MLSLATAIGYGAIGGSATEAVDMWRRLHAWQQARHSAITEGAKAPALAKFIDLGPDLAVALTRVVLGCLAGWLLRSQIEGTYAALVVGASAPALLASLSRANAASTEAFPHKRAYHEHGQVLAEVPEPKREAAR